MNGTTSTRTSGRKLASIHNPAGIWRRENSISMVKVSGVCYNTLMQRTIRIQLQPSPAQAAALAETSRQFTAAFNLFVELGWGTERVECDEAAFSGLLSGENGIADLNSNLTNTARAKAAEALRSAFTLRKDQDRKVSMPRSDACPPRYNVHTYRVDWESQTVRMSLVGGRQTIRFSVPDYAAKYAGYPVDTADLIERDGGGGCMSSCTVPAPEVEPTDQVVGVDLGIDRPAVTSNNHFLGQRRWKAIEGRCFKCIRALQKKGTKAAKRHLRKLKRRRARFRKMRSRPQQADRGRLSSRRDDRAGKPERHPQAHEGSNGATPDQAPDALVVVCAPQGENRVQGRGTGLYGGCG